MVIPNVWDADGVWAHVIGAAGAVTTVAAGAFLFGSSKAAPQVRDWLHKREMAALRRRHDALERRVDAKLDDAFSALGDVLAAAGGDVPVDLQKTQPHLRAIRGDQAAG